MKIDKTLEEAFPVNLDDKILVTFKLEIHKSHVTTSIEWEDKGKGEGCPITLHELIGAIEKYKCSLILHHSDYVVNMAKQIAEQKTTQP